MTLAFVKINQIDCKYQENIQKLAIFVGMLTSKEAVRPDQNKVESNHTDNEHSHSNPDPPVMIYNVAIHKLHGCTSFTLLSQAFQRIAETYTPLHSWSAN